MRSETRLWRYALPLDQAKRMQPRRLWQALIVVCALLTASCGSMTGRGQAKTENPYSVIPEELLKRPLPPVPLAPEAWGRPRHPR